MSGLPGQNKPAASEANSPFRLETDIDVGDWEEASQVGRRHQPGSEYDLNLIALEELLPGTLRFTRFGRPILPVPVRETNWEAFSVWPERNRDGAPIPDETHLAQWFSILVPDLAYQLAYHLDEGDFEVAPDGAHADYHLSVDALVLRFRKDSGMIHILSNELLDRGWMLVVPADEFFAGVRAFLREFAGEVKWRAPDLLAWDTFSSLRKHAG